MNDNQSIREGIEFYKQQYPKLSEKEIRLLIKAEMVGDNAEAGHWHKVNKSRMKKLLIR